MTHAEKMKSVSKKSQEEIQKIRDQELELKRKKEQEQEAKERELAKKDFPGILTSIELAAKNGLNKYDYYIYENVSHNGQRYYIYAETLTELLKKEGYAVKSGSSRREPFGSDPYYSDTVYSYWLTISW